MKRHVIKGRDANREKYLCWARMAPDQKPTEDGFVWLSDQRKAVRWADPRYSGQTRATERARLHNGYFVKLVGPAALTADTIRELQAYIAEHASGASEELACYWFDGDFHDACQDFCRSCAEALVAEKYAADPKRFEELYGDECEDDEARCRAVIDGGFGSDHDSSPYCETCGAKLSGLLTEYGADQELAALTGDCQPTFDDVEGWASLDRAIGNLTDEDPRWRKIAKVIEAARVAERENAAREAALAASPGMAVARATFLSLLAARAEQKAPEPSFPLWSELLAWRALPYEERKRSPEAVALEKRMIPEAKRFAAGLRIEWGWSSGLFMLNVPYGTYYWPFIVEIEQYRLWRPKAFEEGRAYMLDPCPSGDPAWPHHRDANPYPEGSVEYSQWDCGYVGSSHERGIGVRALSTRSGPCPVDCTCLCHTDIKDPGPHHMSTCAFSDPDYCEETPF